MSPRVDENSTEDAGQGSGDRRRPERRTPRFSLPTERIAFAKQSEILRAYGQLGESGRAVPNSDVAGVVGLTAATTSLANGFFASLGLVSKTGEGQVPHPAVVEFARAYAWDPTKAPSKLAPIFKNSWLGAEVLPRVRFRPHSMPEMIALLGEICGVGPEQRGQLETLVSYLDFVGLVRRDGDQILAVAQSASLAEGFVEVPEGGPNVSAPVVEPARPPGLKSVHVPEDFVVYRCKISEGRILDLPLPPKFTRKDVDRVKRFLDTQVDDDPEGGSP